MKRWRRSGNARGTGTLPVPAEPIIPATWNGAGFELTVSWDQLLQDRNSAALAAMFSDDVANSYSLALIDNGHSPDLILEAAPLSPTPSQITYTGVGADPDRLIGQNGLDVADFTIPVE